MKVKGEGQWTVLNIRAIGGFHRIGNIIFNNQMYR